MRRKAQSSVEFLLLAGFMLIIVAVILGVAMSKFSDFNDQKEQRSLKDLGQYIKQEIDIAAGAEDGYMRTFVLPKTIDGNEYDAVLIPYPEATELVLTYDEEDKEYDEVVLITEGVVGVVLEEINILFKKDGLAYLNAYPTEKTCELVNDAGMCDEADTSNPGFKTACAALGVPC